MIPGNPVGDPLEGARAKAGWALKRCKELHEATEAYLSASPWAIETVRATEERSFGRRFRVLHQPPLELGLIAGDVAHNARSSLDHAVHALAGPHGGVQHQFTIALSEDAWVRSWPKQLRKLPTKSVETIEAAQPFRASDIDRHPLALLQWFSNVDKHRVLHPTLASFRRVSFFSPDGSLSPMKDIRIARAGPLSDGDWIAIWDLQEGAEMPQLDFEVTVGVGFGERLVTAQELLRTSETVAGIVLALSA